LARDRGWSVEGLELAEAAGNPHDLTIHRLSFPEEAASLAGESYDVITAWAVFEHLRDPRRAFEACTRLLRPGGRLIIQVPSLRSIHARFALHEDIPRHLYFFSPATLRRFGQLTGLEVTRVDQTTDLFGGSGRGVLRLALVRALGGSVDDYFEVWRTPRRERFRRWPVLAWAWTAVAAIERVLLTDWLVRALGISGQIVVEFHKMNVAGGADK
jgi:SAM-dependent methyltransferase